MSQALPPTIVCTVCAETTQVPGPQGPAGDDGDPGMDGQSAFTFSSGGFTVPAVGATVTVDVDSSEWMTPDMPLNIEAAGAYQVDSIPDEYSVVVENLGYDDNAAPGTPIALGQKISVGGFRGDEGPPWAGTLDDLSPTTTKGDIIVDNGANAPNASTVRVAAGTNTHVLHADSGQASGLRWGAVDVAGAQTAISGALAIANGGTGQTARQAAINALLDSAGSVTGDLAYFNGTNWTRLALGSSVQVLRANSAGNDLEFALPRLVQRTWGGSDNDLIDITGTIPFDDTIPQKTEGTELMSVNITPKTASSYLIIRAWIPIALEAAGAQATAALFEDDDADAIAVATMSLNNDGMNMLCLFHSVSSSSTDVRTYKIRIGTDNGSHVYINGVAAGRRFGGIALAWMLVDESLTGV